MKRCVMQQLQAGSQGIDYKSLLDYHFNVVIHCAIFLASSLGTCGIGGISVEYPGQFCGCGL
jgi:hypothetical protein